MKKLPVLFLTVLLTFNAAMADEKYEDLFVPEVKVGDHVLVRKGVSVLTVGYVFKVDVAAFYQLKESGPEDALADQPRHIVIEYLRDIPSKDFIKAGDETLAKQHSKETVQSIQPGIDQINKLYQDVKKGDRYALSYLPGTGTILQFNGETKGVIEGAEFARVYFTIWLGENNPYREFSRRLVGLK